jgi:hypothetical protein
VSWRKLGQLFVPDGSLPWARGYAANPVAERIEGDLYRIYFSSRDAENRSSIGFVEIDITNPFTILHVAEEPALRYGDLAMFDDSGASIGCIVPVNGRRHLYYMGWHLTVRVPWQNALGLAVAEGGPTTRPRFQRQSRFPMMALDEVDPYTISYPWVMRDGELFRMWYGSNTSWGAERADMRHLIKYAESQDGINWHRPDVVAIDFARPDEYAICKPCVVKDPDLYRMWFSARGESYRIYYAESEDGIAWRRTAEPDLDVSESGWDSTMVEYPFVFDHGGSRYMLYCGNEFGRTGFGLAVRE